MTLYNTKQVSEILKVSERYVRQLIAEKKLTAIKIGRIWVITEVEVKKYVSMHE